MKKVIGILGLGVCLFVCEAAAPTTLYVDGSIPASGDGKSWETAFKTIQGGIDAASDGDTVIVAEGMYVENIGFMGKNITLTSTDPLDAGVVAQTVIDGSAATGWVSVVAFSGTENETCVLAGFTIQNGTGAPSGGGGISGGTPDSHTHATIEQNVVTANYAWAGGGVFGCDGVIRNNQITHNTAGDGGGIASCDGIIEHNVITSNHAPGDGGGGLYACNGTIQDNVITDNWTTMDESAGGGLYSCNGTIRNNVISRNKSRCHGAGGLSVCNGTIENNVIAYNSSDSDGAGLYNCTGTIRNNTIWGNSGWSGGGLFGCTGVIRNCIIGGNSPPGSPQLADSSQPTYSCIEDWPGGGEGNIPFVPYFVDAENGDFHLLPWSPCIDAGDPSSDFSKEPEPNGGRIDMGAYGNTPEATSKSADSDSDGLPDGWEYQWFGTLQWDGASSPDGDPIANLTEYHYGWDPETPAPTVVENLTKAKWYLTIQSALTESGHGDELVVYPGIYRENINLFGKNVILRSTDPFDRTVVAGTIIDGSKAAPVVTFSGTEDETCVLSGFTIQNGESSLEGGGIFGGWSENRTHATIQYNVITNNPGGGIACCDGLIRNNVISHNPTGGGLYSCNGVIENCTIVSNTAVWGGGLYHCQGAITNCIIWGNIAERYPDMYNSTDPTYSRIQFWSGGTVTNADPYFVDPEGGDYRLLSWSACIDAGDPLSDFSNEPQPNGGRIDMGAYGNTPSATSKSPDGDADGLPDGWEWHRVGTLDGDGDSDPDGDHIPNSSEYRHGWDPRIPAATLVENVTGSQWYETIQDALCESAYGDEIIVHPGTYRENIYFFGKNVVLRSTHPSAADTVAKTILDGGGVAPVIFFNGNENETCVLSGFTIRNGAAHWGAGIAGNATHATIQNNVITQNSAGWGGGGLYGCHGVIQNNIISGNSARWSSGGGLSSCDGLIRNNTIVGNECEWGAGLSGCYGSIRNCIIWGNIGSNDPQIYSSHEPTYSCIQDWSVGRDTNVADDPRLVDAENGDFRLMPDSPCIDAGFNDPELPETDIAGMHRIMFGGKGLTVDMGAYEYYVNILELGLGEREATFTWSSLADKTYSIFYSHDLFTWHLAIQNLVSAGDTTTSWTDDGTATEVLPFLVPRRFYRVRENP